MRNIWLVSALVVLAAAPAYAEEKKKAPTKPKKLGKDFWRSIVKPNAKWTLVSSNDKSEKIVIETYDVRKVGEADVARIRWTHVSGKEKEDIGATDSGKPTQVAVTDKGLYLLNAKNDDAVVAERLKGKPSRSSPPKEYEPTKKNQGRYLTINPFGLLCYGEGPIPGQGGECEDVCDAYVCMDEGGFHSLSGLWAPGYDDFERQ